MDTLSSAGPGLVNLADRRARLRLLAFPRGASRARFGSDGRLRSREGRWAWTLRVTSRRTHRIRLTASLATLARPFVPAAVLVDGRPLPRGAWSYNRRARTLTASFRARRATLAVIR